MHLAKALSHTTQRKSTNKAFNFFTTGVMRIKTQHYNLINQKLA